MRRKLIGCAPVILAAASVAVGQVTSQFTTLVGSTNWSGYYVTGNDFTQVSSTWVIPALTAPSSGTTYAANWVGLDGATNSTVEQCGIAESITSGGVGTYSAWYEFAPTVSMTVSLTVHPGDTIFAETAYEASESTTGNYAYFFDIDDETTGKSYSNTIDTSSNDAHASAEWIQEAPTLVSKGKDVQSTLTNFGSITFTNAVAAVNNSTTTAGISTYTNDQVEMIQGSSIIALPSALNNTGEDFNINYGSAAPNFTWDNAGGSSPSDGKIWDIGNNNNWNSGTTATFYSDGSNVTFNDTNNGHYAVTLNSTVQPASVTVNASGNYTISGTGNIGGSASLTKSGSGTLNLSTSNTYTGGTTISAGTLVVGANGALSDGAVKVSGGTLQLASSTGLAQMTSLSISGSGAFDIENNNFSVADPGGAANDSTYANIIGWVKSGAIKSSAGFSGYGVGVVDGNANIDGSPVSANTIEAAYTLDGDANLDGKVDITDFNIFAPNFGLSTTLGWEAGDFNYSGTVDIADFNLFSSNMGLSDNGTDFSIPAADMAAIDAFAAVNDSSLVTAGALSPVSVPEPASLALLAIGAFGILSRRRRCLTNPAE